MDLQAYLDQKRAEMRAMEQERLEKEERELRRAAEIFAGIPAMAQDWFTEGFAFTPEPEALFITGFNFRHKGWEATIGIEVSPDLLQIRSRFTYDERDGSFTRAYTSGWTFWANDTEEWRYISRLDTFTNFEEAVYAIPEAEKLARDMQSACQRWREEERKDEEAISKAAKQPPEPTTLEKAAEFLSETHPWNITLDNRARMAWAYAAIASAEILGDIKTTLDQVRRAVSQVSATMPD